MFQILIFLLVISVLVFWHELGHFLAAKACGIYVDRFSVGMPPRILGKRIGETDYCIGALPIGGFVKMAGQEDAPLSEEEREEEYGHVPPERWFNNKPVWQRLIVIVAGPLMNVVLAVMLYAIIASVGANVPEYEVSSRIGLIPAEMPAASAPMWRIPEPGAAPDFSAEPDAAGWHTGDRIISVDGRNVDNITDVAFETVLDGADKEHTLLIERPVLDGENEYYLSRVVPEVDEETGYPRFGIAPFQTALVGEVMPGTPAAEAGLKPGDVIRRLNGRFIDSTTFSQAIEDLPEGTSIRLDIERGGELIEREAQLHTIGRIQDVVIGAADGAGADEADARVPEVIYTSDEGKEATGLHRYDKIVAINGAPATVGLLKEVQKDSPGEELMLTVERPPVLFGLLQRGGTFELEVPVEPVQAVGVVWEPTLVYHREPVGNIIPEAFRQSYLALERTLLTLKALIWGDVSVRDLGGPVMILQVTSQAAEAGWQWLLRISAFISINLAIFNLLPLPVLDGGLVVLTTIEGIRRKPIDARVQERFQQVGVLFIISLMLFITWNDIGRWIESIRP